MNIRELEEWMKSECFNETSYSIGGKPAPFEGFVLNPKGDFFEWYYTERGIIEIIETFDNEEKACLFAFEQMKNDKTARSHLVGFFKSEKFQKEMCQELETRNIEFKTDKIPYDIDSLRYRIFVFGCDYKKVVDLKEKYKEN